MQTRSTSAAEVAVSLRSSSLLIPSIWTMSRVARRIVSGCAAACKPSKRFELSISAAELEVDNPFKLLLSIISEHIPNATNGSDQFYFPFEVNLVTKILHVHVDNVRGGIVRNAPHVFHKSLARDRFAHVVHQVLKKGELTHRQVDSPVAAHHPM